MRLLSYALSDPLTGLPNRRAIYEELERLQGRALREGGSIPVGVIDLDGFKSINDAHGHQNGDLFLQEMGRRLAASLRAPDMLGRLGGDEFVLIGPPAPGARRLRSHRPRGPARRGRGGRARAGGPHGRGHARQLPAGEITLPTICQRRRGGVGSARLSAEEAVRLADTRMYVVKRARKGARVMHWSAAGGVTARRQRASL